MDSKISRRDVLGRGAALGILTVIGSTAACSKEQKALKCTDTTALSTADLQARTALQYMDTSVEPGKNCTGCQQFQPAAPDTCGTCKVVKGPINPKGYCKSFVAKPA